MNKANDAQMKNTHYGRKLRSIYPKLPFRERIVREICRSEGGEMFSVNLRLLLLEHYDVRVGDYSYGSLLIPGYCDPKTTIGRYVSIGPNVRRFGAAHPMTSAGLHPFWYNPVFGFADGDVERTPCEIHHDSWIGSNTVILPGCGRIGIGSVIGAGSVVTQDVPDFTIVAGNPARVLRPRFNDQQRELLLAAQPWLLDPATATDSVYELTERISRIK